MESIRRGSIGKGGSGTGILRRSPKGMRIEHEVHFGFTMTNNKAEYEAFLGEARMAAAVGVDSVELHIDLQLVKRQIAGELIPNEDKMARFKGTTIKAMESSLATLK